ncbi:hypothetical protein HPP92_021831 [Vanilla planifolia]|uniref:Uncharacterized protein n=1 Tax=Vanilla planifolia TaxID=51239 RepID=A0A835Q1W9_VANPL|nr:hypothetical protein HPP92_021831 [Vanilla planifolia]
MSTIPQSTAQYTPQDPHTTSSSHPNGSYGPVFAVLAVIAVLAVSACVVGRLCGRRLRREEGRAERGFGSAVPAGKLVKGERTEDLERRGEAKGGKAEGYIGGNVGFKVRP